MQTTKHGQRKAQRKTVEKYKTEDRPEAMENKAGNIEDTRGHMRTRDQAQGHRRHRRAVKE